MATTTGWITARAHPDGAEACVRDTNINVWGLVEWRRQGLSDADILQAVHGLAQNDLEAAWAYYAAHAAEIEEAIQQNAEGPSTFRNVIK